MPLYEYDCYNCGAYKCMLCSLEDRPETLDCPECKWKMERKVSQTTFRLEGGGWAASGYSKGD